MHHDTKSEEVLGGGRLLAEITNRIVALMREHYGRGPIRAKTYVLDNLIVCVLSEGFTPIERTMMEGGEPDRVLAMRRDFQQPGHGHVNPFPLPEAARTRYSDAHGAARVVATSHLSSKRWITVR